MPWRYGRWYRKKKKKTYSWYRVQGPTLHEPDNPPQKPTPFDVKPRPKLKPIGPILNDPVAKLGPKKIIAKPRRPRNDPRIPRPDYLQAPPPPMEFQSPWETIHSIANKNQDALRPWYVPQGYDMTKSFSENFKNSLNKYPKNFTADKALDAANRYLFSQDAYQTDPETGQKVATMFGMNAKDAAAYTPWITLPGLPGEGALLGTAGKIFSKAFPKVTQTWRGANYWLHQGLKNAEGILGGQGAPTWSEALGKWITKNTPEEAKYIRDFDWSAKPYPTPNYVPNPNYPKKYGPQTTLGGGKFNVGKATPTNALWPVQGQPPPAPFWAKFNQGIRNFVPNANETIRGSVERQMARR
jgi:hypothetical protein